MEIFWTVILLFNFGCAGLRMVSCGRDNVRLWRVRNGTLRSCPVNLGEYHSMDFTDVAFEEGNFSNHSLDDRTLWVGKPVTTLHSIGRNINLIEVHWKGSYKKLDIFPLTALPQICQQSEWAYFWDRLQQSSYQKCQETVACTAAACRS